jgi:F0F1-type ATP synthase beta subunit
LCLFTTRATTRGHTNGGRVVLEGSNRGFPLDPQALTRRLHWSAADRARHAQAVAEVFRFMRKRKLTLADLIEVGGQDLQSPDSQIVNRARAIEKCWALMAQVSVSYSDLEVAS